jgi:hypothetical protein
MFALSLAYAFYLQRRAFSSRSKLRNEKEELAEISRASELEEDAPDDDLIDTVETPADSTRASWPRLGR